MVDVDVASEGVLPSLPHPVMDDVGGQRLDTLAALPDMKLLLEAVEEE